MFIFRFIIFLTNFSPRETWISLAELFWWILLPLLTKVLYKFSFFEEILKLNSYNLGTIYKKLYAFFGTEADQGIVQ